MDLMYIRYEGTGFIWLRFRPVAGSYGHGNEPSESKKRREILD
jgi:hypothetical protein